MIQYSIFMAHVSYSSFFNVIWRLKEWLDVYVENTGSVVDGKVNVDTDGDGIGNYFCTAVLNYTTISTSTSGEYQYQLWNCLLSSSSFLKVKVSELVQKISTLESELKAHKLLFKDVVGQLVKKVKALELNLKTRSRKVVMSESDKEEEEEQDMDPLIKLAKAAAASDAHVDVFPGADIPPSPPLPTDMSAGVSFGVSTGAPTSPSTLSPGSTTVPTSSSVPAAETIPASSSTTPETPSSPVRDARKGKGVAVDEPTPTHDTTFKQLEEERLARMVALVNTQRKELAEQQAKEWRERPMTPSQLRQYMRTYLQEEFDKIQRAVAFTRGLKRDGSPMTSASSKKLKTGDDEVNVEAPSHGVPQEEEGATPSQNVSREEVAAPSYSQDILDAPVEVPSNIASIAQHAASSLKKVGTKKKRLGRKGVHTSQILLSMGLGSINAFYRLDNSRKYFASLREILHLVTRADLMTIYGCVMTFYQDKKATGAGLVLWGDLKVLIDSPEVNDGNDVWKNQNTWSIQSWKLYSYSGVHVLETVGGLVVHMFVDKKYPLSINLIERMLDHQLEICQDTVGNELTIAVQLIAFLKKQISDSRRPKVHDCPCLDADFLVADSKFLKVAFGDGFKMLLFNPLVISTKDLSRNLKYVVPIGRVNVPTGSVVPTGKDSSIVSTGSTKVIPVGSIILVLVVLCLLRVVIKVS
ncbi:hypothetical protein Tco_0937069 [Tanacetum coccineum]|uniref:Uncharacterized protein n=1 Tax=Tanacetum coccineum TaxID=301880 RepID=A0ABQ5DDX1_9ASTR